MLSLQAFQTDFHYSFRRIELHFALERSSGYFELCKNLDKKEVDIYFSRKFFAHRHLRLVRVQVSSAFYEEVYLGIRYWLYTNITTYTS